jgi:hypothetical protein
MSEAALQLDDFNTTDLRSLADRMLEETYRRYLGLGLAPAAAAEAAVAEFGDPRLIAAAFARMHPARLAARRLLAIGPVVGTGWVVALVTGAAPGPGRSRCSSGSCPA